MNRPYDELEVFRLPEETEMSLDTLRELLDWHRNTVYSRYR